MKLLNYVARWRINNNDNHLAEPSRTNIGLDDLRMIVVVVVMLADSLT